MKRRKFALAGKTDSKGNLLIYNKRQFNDFLKSWKSQDFIMEISVTQPKTSEALIAYYYKAIVPDFQHAFKEVDGERMSLSEVDIKLRKMSSVMHEEIPDEENGGFDLVRIIKIEEAGNHMASEFVEDLVLIGATRYSIEVKQPN